MSEIYQPQWPPGPTMPAWNGHWPPPAPPPSTRGLTVAKWVTVGVVLLLMPLMGLWIRHGYSVIDGLRRLGAIADAESGDDKGLKGGADAIAWWEFLVIVEWATLVVVVLWWLPGATRGLRAKAVMKGSGRR